MVAYLGLRPLRRERMSERKGLTLPSAPFSAGNKDTMSTSTAPVCMWITRWDALTLVYKFWHLMRHLRTHGSLGLWLGA